MYYLYMSKLSFLKGEPTFIKEESNFESLHSRDLKLQNFSARFGCVNKNCVLRRHFESVIF